MRTEIRKFALGAFALVFFAALAAVVLLPSPAPVSAASGKNIAVGEVNNLVVFVRFQGEGEFVDDAYMTVMEGMYNDSDVSVRQYFEEVSLGKLELNTFFLSPSGSAVASVQVSKPRGYYEPYSATNRIGYSETERGGKEHIDRFYREQQLVREVIRAVEVPAYVDLDNDDDGKVDSLSFMVSGTVGNDEWSDLLWPHMTAFYTFDTFVTSQYYVPTEYWKDNPKPTDDGLTLTGGLEFEDYNFLSEGYIMQNKLEGAYSDYGEIGVICHELMHTLGAMDYYSYEEGNQNYDSVGELDIMGSTDYMPQFPLSHIRRKMGWLEDEKNILSLSGGGTYTLYPTTDGDRNIKAYEIKLPDYSRTGQYFMIEARSNAGTRFDSGLSSSGLVIYRVNTRAGDNGNMYGDDEVFVYRAKHAKYNPSGMLTNYAERMPNGDVARYSYSIFGQAQGDGSYSAAETHVTSFGRTGTEKYLSSQYPDLIYYRGTDYQSYEDRNSGIAVEDIIVHADGAVTFTLNIDGDRGSGDGVSQAAPMDGYPALHKTESDAVTVKYAVTGYNQIAYTLVGSADTAFTAEEVYAIANGAAGDLPDGVLGVKKISLGVPLYEYRVRMDGLTPDTKYKCYSLIVWDNVLSTAVFRPLSVTTRAAGQSAVVNETVTGSMDFAKSYPQLVSARADGTVTFAVKTDAAGAWCYYIALPSGSDAPSADQVMLGEGSSVAASGAFRVQTNVKTTREIALSSGGKYDIYIVMKNTSGNMSAVKMLSANTETSSRATGISCGTFGRKGAAGLAAGGAVLSVAAFLLMKRK